MIHRDLRRVAASHGSEGRPERRRAGEDREAGHDEVVVERRLEPNLKITQKKTYLEKFISLAFLVLLCSLSFCYLCDESF
jgi:hypothetical protein